MTLDKAVKKVWKLLLDPSIEKVYIRIFIYNKQIDDISNKYFIVEVL